MSYLMRVPISRLKYDNFKTLCSVCPLCRQIRPVQYTIQPQTLYRQQSTTTAKTSLLLTAKKKTKKKTGKELYSDVIQVTETLGINAKQRRTLVKKSSAKHVLDGLPVVRNDASKDGQTGKSNKRKTASQIDNCDNKTAANYLQERVSVTDVIRNSDILKELDSSQTVAHSSYSEIQPLSCMQFERYDEHQEMLSDASAEINEDDVGNADNKLAENDTKYEKLRLTKEDLEKMSKVKQLDRRKIAYNIIDNQSIAAFVDVCINCNMVTQAHNALLTHRARIKLLQHQKKEMEVTVFNRVMNAQSLKGNWARVKELLFVMREDGVKPTLQTYAALLDCISRLPSQDKKTITNILADIQKDGLDLCNIDKECAFIEDQRDRVIEVIRIVQPNFEPYPLISQESYDCSLLQNFTEKVERFQSKGSEDFCTEEELLRNAERQMQLEINGYLTVRSIQNTPHVADDAKTQKMRQLLHNCETIWRNSLTKRLKISLETLKNENTRGKNMRNVNLYPFLTALNVEEYVEIMMLEIQSLAEASETFSLSMSALCNNVGNRVMQRYLVHTKQENKLVDKIMNIYNEYCKYQGKPNSAAVESAREQWMMLLQNHTKGPTLDAEEVIWPKHILNGVGRFLYKILLLETTFDASLLRSVDNVEASKRKLPAFYTIYRNSTTYIKEEVKPHPFLVRLFRMAAKETLTFESTIVPMVSPPLPWTSIRSGGYLLSSAKMIRLPSTAVLQRMRLRNTPNRQLWPVFDSLNQLSECCWTINKPILEIIISIFNNKGDESLDIPPPPIDLSSLPKLHSEMTKEEKAKLYRERLTLQRKRAEMFSLWCDALYRLSIANHFKDDAFWFPHNMDFRGRVYPCPPHFNHLGGDVARSLLLFKKGEPLGEKGLDWLKIHLVNLTGLKKREPLKERLRFANELMPEIIDSANNPLDGNRWWTKSEEPWQTLACCKEIVKATASEDPSKYICHFPIHQDGSCNGLQHYSALGRDILGAEQVNLHPKDKPADVYSGVAHLVEIERSKDAAAGDEIAKVLEGYVQRKVIKQTVMTTVYGVTRYGARLQILKQLKALPDFPMEKQWAASTYLVQKTFQSLQKMFTATKEIQDWFTETARLVSQVCSQPVEWVTPLGLPVVQPYHRPSTLTFKFGLDRHSTTNLDITDKPNVMKQKNAFPPNYIHSLDSTHMMLTSLYCRREGIMFVSVHDCFWTHPATVEIMNRICREQFVALHSLPLLDQLSQFFINKYSYAESELSHDGSVVDTTKKRLNRLLERVPKTGEFQLENVLQSTYFFS